MAVGAPLARRQAAVLVAAAALASVLLAITAGEGWRMATLFVLGVLLGLTLYLTAFSFASSYRNLLVRGETVMDIGIMLGALAAAGLTGRFAPRLNMSLRSLAAAVIGGVAMGYGARVAYGCNIGAFFSGVASTSLHGWLWIAAALAGCWIGIHLRPRFGLVN